MKTSRFDQRGLLWCVAASFLVSSLCSTTLAKEADAEQDVSYVAMFDQLLRTADAKRDAAYAERSSITGGLREELMVPAGLRLLVASWDTARLFGIPAIEYRSEDGRVTLSWEAKLRPIGDAEDIQPEFLKRVRSLGFERADDDLVTHLRERYRQIVDRRDSAAQHAGAFRRNAGDVVEEVVVRGLEGGLIGGRYDVEIELVWAISTETELPAPTVSQLFKACPLLEPPRSEDELDAVLADEPVYLFRLRYGRKPLYSDWKAAVPAAVQPRIETTLKRIGFQPGRTYELHPPYYAEGTKQLTWDRTSNRTHVHLIPIVTQPRLVLAYHPPQRVKEPLKPVAMEGMAFPNRQRDQDDIRRWEELAHRTAQADWQHDPWHVHGSPSTNDYRTSWRLQEGKDRILHAIQLRASPYTRDPRRISWLRLDARWRPAASGWGADFTCDTIGTPKRPADDPTCKRWYIYFRHYRDDSAHPTLTLSYYPGLSTYSDVKRLGGTTYDLYVRTEPAANNCVSDTTLKSWITSPETLRDTGLAWVDKLSDEVEQRIRSGAAVRRAYVVEEASSNRRRHLRSGTRFVALPVQLSLPKSPLMRLVAVEPPLDEPPPVQPSERKLTQDEQDELVREFQEKIKRQRQLLRENCTVMHAALLRAFPLLELEEK